MEFKPTHEVLLADYKTSAQWMRVDLGPNEVYQDADGNLHGELPAHRVRPLDDVSSLR